MTPTSTNCGLVMRDEQGWERMKIMLEEGPEEETLSVSLAQPVGAAGRH